MRTRARRARFVLRERRRCARDGFCRMCLSDVLVPLARAVRDLMPPGEFREHLDWARGEREDPAWLGPFAALEGVTLTEDREDDEGPDLLKPLTGYALYLLNRYGGSGGRPGPERIP